MIQNIFSSLIEISISMSILIVFLIIFGKQLRNSFSANWRILAFMFICVRMLIPIEISLKGVPIELHLTNFKLGFSIASYIWIVGIILIASTYTIKYFAFWHMVSRWGTPPQGDRIHKCLRKAKFGTDILDINPEIIICKKLSSPVAAGITRRRILLPSEDYTDDDLESIFCHELVHCKHYDVVKKVVGLVVCTIYWFCPFVWIMALALERDTELSCDTEVVYHSGEVYRATYGKTILLSIARELSPQQKIQTPLIATFNGRKAFLKARIKNIVTVKKNSGGLTSIIIFSVAVIIINIFVTVL